MQSMQNVLNRASSRGFCFERLPVVNFRPWPVSNGRVQEPAGPSRPSTRLSSVQQFSQKFLLSENSIKAKMNCSFSFLCFSHSHRFFIICDRPPNASKNQTVKLELNPSDPIKIPAVCVTQTIQWRWSQSKKTLDRSSKYRKMLETLEQSLIGFWIHIYSGHRFFGQDPQFFPRINDAVWSDRSAFERVHRCKERPSCA